MSCISQASVFKCTWRQMEIGITLLKSMKRVLSWQIAVFPPLPQFQSCFSELVHLLALSHPIPHVFEETLPSSLLFGSPFHRCLLLCVAQRGLSAQTTE